MRHNVQNLKPLSPTSEMEPSFSYPHYALAWLDLGPGGPQASASFQQYRVEVRDLHADSFGASRHTSAMLLRSPQSHWYAGLYQSHVIACCAVKNGLLSDFCVAKTHRRKGVGRWLLRHLPRHLVARVEDGTRHFYESSGFHMVPRVHHPEAARWESMWAKLVWMQR